MNGATNVPRTSVVLVQFTEPVFNVDATSFRLLGSAGGIFGTVTTISTVTYTFSPSAPLPANDTIVVSLTSGIEDGSGNPLMATSFSFMTAP